jgi:hypothetical protein
MLLTKKLSQLRTKLVKDELYTTGYYSDSFVGQESTMYELLVYSILTVTTSDQEENTSL